MKRLNPRSKYGHVETPPPKSGLLRTEYSIVAAAIFEKTKKVDHNI